VTPFRSPPLDSLGREIQAVLELIRPLVNDDPASPRYEGYCGAASEAYLHLSGSPELRVMRRANRDGSSHWWLIGNGAAIDLTLSPSDRRALKRGQREPYPYGHGARAAFRNGRATPSRRAAAIIQLVQSRRDSA
jgi:hypothetical protein